MNGCPGSQMLDLRATTGAPAESGAPEPSQLRQWPVQMHLINPGAPYFKSADLLLAADCTAYALGGFHGDFLKGKSLAIACPKLDEGQDSYVEKLVALIDEAKINTLTVLIMQVPCCGGLLQLARQAQTQANRKVPIKSVVVGLQGDIISEDWV